ARHWVAIALNKFVLIWMKRSSWVTGPDGITTGAAWPLSGVAVTLNSTPACEELETVVPACFELIVTSVRRPTTAEGVTTNTLPLPLDVFIVVLTVVTAGCRRSKSKSSEERKEFFGGPRAEMRQWKPHQTGFRASERGLFPG